MANNAGYRRKAKFAPGAVLESVQLVAINGLPVKELTRYVVLDVCKAPIKHKNLIEYYYKVYSKNNKTIQFIQPRIIEEMKQVDLVNVGNLRVLLDDAVNGFDATPPAPPPNPTLTLPKGLTFIPIKITIKK